MRIKNSLIVKLPAFGNLLNSLRNGQISVLMLGFFVYFLSFHALETKSKIPLKKKSPSNQTEIRQTIILSIDGFPAYYWSNPKYHSYFPKLAALFQKYGVSEIETVNPSVTYPAHTSMVTGKEPAIHGIYNNTLSDPFDKNDGGWMWYAEDILVPTLWDLAKKNRKTTANVFWPVTVGADIQWNLPQFWRKKIPEDDKLLRVLSTKGLHKEAEIAVGAPLNDVTKDELKLKTATWLFQTKKPTLMFVYTTDLDSNHHAYGPNSEKALTRLSELDNAISQFLTSVGAFSPKGPAILIVSDHGFSSAEEICAPNVVLKNKGYISDEMGTYQLTFKSAGGTSLLLAAPNVTIREEEIQSIVSEIETICPGAEWLPATNNNWIGSQIHPNALGLFLTKQAMFFSGTRKGEVFSKSQTKIHGHGYWNQNSEMKTIGFVYDPTGYKHKFQSVKDVYDIVKTMLGLKEKKEKGFRVPQNPDKI